MEQNFKNAVERFPLIDTILISDNVTDFYPNVGWFENYSDIAATTKLSFFTRRNEAMVGTAYNTQDSIDKLNYAYHVDSIGVEFRAPISEFATLEGEDKSFQFMPNSYSAWLFATEIPKHCGISLKVSQDEKLTLPTMLAPAGVGFGGNVSQAVSLPPSTFGSTIVTVNNGVASCDNRFPIPGGVDIPRNCNYSVELDLSPIARSILGLLIGPSFTPFDADNGPISSAMIRVSLYGQREVQQRGQLHY